MEKIREQHKQAQKLVYKDTTVHNIQVTEEQSVISILTDVPQDTLEEESVATCNSIKLQSVNHRSEPEPQKPVVGHSEALGFVVIPAFPHSQPKVLERSSMKYNSSLLNEIISPTMMYKEASETAEAYFIHFMNKETSSKDRILHTFC